MKIVFWQESLSPHQAPLLHALEEEGHDVTLVASFVLSRARLRLGWTPPEYKRVRVILRPDKQRIEGLLKADIKETTHIMSGVDSYPLVRYATKLNLGTSLQLGVYSEARNWHGFAGLARRAKGLYDAHHYGDKIKFVLCAGELGVQWFELCGFSRSQLYQFGYFIGGVLPEPPIRADKTFTLAFVGQLTHRKGVDLLIRALGSIQRENWRLMVIGGGPEAPRLQSLAARLGIASYVGFLNVQDSAEIAASLRRTDCLVLPSRWDGWGMVVSEAYAHGSRVICSDRCGAAVLVKHSSNGFIVPSGRKGIGKLTDALRTMVDTGIVSDEERASTRTWARRITGAAGANYLTRILSHVAGSGDRPSPPWATRPAPPEGS